MRKVIALTAAAGLLLTLAGCTVSAPSGECEPIPAGDASKLVAVTGAFDEAPTVEFPTPLASDVLEVSVLTEGDGTRVRLSDYVDIHYTAFNPSTGEKLTETAAASLVASLDSDASRLFECLPVGSRVAALLPETEEAQSAIFVIDIDKATTTKATGRIELPARGMPSVVTAPNGQPGLTILDEDPPAALKYSTLITGDGKKVSTGDQLLLQYTVVNWDSKAVVESTWDERQHPQARKLTKFDASTGDGISAGSLTALSGKTVGSQVLVVLPPSTWAASDIQAAEGATLVVVYDILGIIE